MNAIVGMTYRKVRGSNRQPIEPAEYVKIDGIDFKATITGGVTITHVWAINRFGDRFRWLWTDFRKQFDYTRQYGQPAILHDKHIWQRLTDALSTGIMDCVSHAYGAAPYIKEREY